MSNSRTTPPDSTGGVVIADSVERSALAVLCALFFALFLTSCGPSDSFTPGSNASSTTGKTLASISVPAPPGAADHPLEPGQSGMKYLPNGMPAFQPARGVNADMLFAEKITNTEDRFRRVENAVTDLRREFDAVMPAIVRLTAVENDMQELLKQLQTLTGSPDTAASELDAAPIQTVTSDALPAPALPAFTTSAANAATPAPAIAPQAAATPPPAPEFAPPERPVERMEEKPPDKPPPGINPSLSEALLAQGSDAPVEHPVAATQQPIGETQKNLGMPTVSAIRTGEQDRGFIRIVLDLSGPTPHHSDLDNDEHLLLVEMPKAGWSAKPKGDFASSPLLKSWTTEPMQDGTGTRLVIQLQRGAKIVSDIVLTDPARIVLDLKPGE